MGGKGTSRLGLGLAAWAACALGTAWAAAPWDRLMVDADPQKPYTLTEDNGPWMIMAASFSGAHAMEQAHDLVLEFRSEHKLPAYVHQMKFDLGDTGARGFNKDGTPTRMIYRRGKAEYDEIAVLVGNYRAVDDPDAAKTLMDIKHMHSKVLEGDPAHPENAKPTYQNLAALRYSEYEYLTKNPQHGAARGMMAMAFVTANPLLPREFFAPRGVDEFVLRLNRGVQYCLLDCPGKYSVQVAHFTGNVVIDQAEIAAINRGLKPMDNQLAKAGENAHKITMALRKLGYEAYEFHDRGASIVTVSSFDELGSPRSDGRIELQPKIARIIQVFGTSQGDLGYQPQGAVLTKMLDHIPLDATPLPVEVPKRSIAADYRRDAMTQR